MVRKVWNWIGIDGLLHFLVSAMIVQTVCLVLNTPILAIVIAVIAGLSKEVWDVLIQKDNTIKQALHDIACNLIGITCGTLTYILF